MIHPSSARLRRWALAAGLIALTFMAYWPVLHGEFVWDDLMVVAKNPLVTGEFSLSNIWFRTDFPLTSVALWLQWLLWGPHPAGYHIVNVALHALNAVLVWQLLERLFGGLNGLNGLNDLTESGLPSTPAIYNWAWFSAALFAVHPVAVASAGWISEQKNTLSLLLALLAFVFYVKSSAVRERSAKVRGQRSEVRGQRSGNSPRSTANSPHPGPLPKGEGESSADAVQNECVTGADPAAKGLPLPLREGRGEGNSADEHPGARIQHVEAPSHDPSSSALYLLSLLFFVLALLAKTSTVVLPAVLVLWTWWQGRLQVESCRVQVDSAASRQPTSKADPTAESAGQPSTLNLQLSTFLRTAPFFLLALGFGAMTVWFQAHQAFTTATVQTEDFWGRLAGAGWAVWFYLGKALLPLNLNLIYPRWQIRPENWSAWLPLAGLVAALTVGSWAGFRRARPRSGEMASIRARGRERARWEARDWACTAFLALACFVVCLFPALGFFDFFYLAISRVSDQFQYLALIPMMAAVVAVGAVISNQWSVIGQRSEVRGQRSETMESLSRFTFHVSRFTAAAVIVAFTLLTFQRAKIFASNERLWADVLARNPTAWTAHNNLGCILAEQKKYDAAADEFAASLRYYRQNEQAHLNLGKTLLLRGQVAEAEAHFQTATQLKPGDGEAHKLLGTVFARQGRNQEALREWRAGLQLAPDLDTRLQLARLLAALGRTTEAVAEFRQAVGAYPKAVAPVNDLAWTLATCADPKVRDGIEAIRLAERACQLTGYREAVPVGTLAAAYAAAGRFSEAANIAESAIKLANASGNQRFVALTQQLLALYRDGKAFTEAGGRGKGSN